jgi:hypothetical protein
MGIIPLPAQFERDGDEALSDKMASERLEIERGAAEAVDCNDNGSGSLAGRDVPERIGKGFTVRGLPVVPGAGGGHAKPILNRIGWMNRIFRTGTAC